MHILHFSGPSTQNKTKPKGTEQTSDSSGTQREQDPTKGQRKTALNGAGDKPGFVSSQSRQEDILAISAKGHAASNSARSQSADEIDGSSDDNSVDRRVGETLNIPVEFMEKVISGKLIDSSTDSSSSSSLNASQLFGYHDSRENVDTQRSPKDGYKEPYNAQFPKSKDRQGFLKH